MYKKVFQDFNTTAYGIEYNKRRKIELERSAPNTNARKEVYEIIKKSIANGIDKKEIVAEIMSREEIVKVLKTIESPDRKLEDYLEIWIDDQLKKFNKQKDRGEER